MAAFPAPATPLPVRRDIVESFEREWQALANPGSFFTGAEQVTIARTFRALLGGSEARAELDEAATEVVAVLTNEPGSIRRNWVQALFDAGLTEGRYVELVSVVSRIAAVDGFHRMIGAALPPLPSPQPGAPTGTTEPAAKPSKAFVPMVRGTSIWWALTLVPKAYERMEDLHCILYLAPGQMQQSESPRAISRPQMELIAARTSLHNECFY